MENGVLMLYTGHAEGASLAALGQVFRSLGRGLRVCVVQFVNGGIDFRPLISREAFRERGQWYGSSLGQVDRSGGSDSRAVDGPTAWQSAKEAVVSGKFELVILDGLLELLKTGAIDEAEAIQCLCDRPEGVNVMITGESASPALIETADLVTKVTDLKQAGSENSGAL